MLQFLYIDPGTGSMLFSILIGAAATLFFLAKALFLKLKVFFSGKKHGVTVDASHKDYIIYCEGKQYYNVFLPIITEAERRGINITYYTSNKEDPVLSAQYKHIESEYIGDGNAAYAKLNMASGYFFLTTTPSLQVYQWKRSKRVSHYCHVLHMPNDATTYRLFGLDYFDSVLLTGDYQKADIRELEAQRNLPKKELVTVGCTYLDVLSEKMRSIRESEKGSSTTNSADAKKDSAKGEKPFTVLVSPSWGAVSVLSRFGERLLDPLIDTGWNIIIRPHPQSKKSEPELLNRLTARYKDRPNVKWDYERDNIYSLMKADLMISDFSGIIFDYTFLCDKPVMYVASKMDLRPYDAYDLDHELWQFQTLKKMGIELREEDFPRIKDVIKSASDSVELRDERAVARDTAYMYAGKAGVKVVDFMEKTVSALKESELKKAS